MALLWLAVWQLAAAAVGKELLIPYPRAVFLTLAELGKTAEFWRAVLLTMLRITAGYVSGLIIGSICAVLSARFRVFRDIFAPILHLIRAVPVASFIILALVWIKSAYLSVFISFLMVLPMIWSNVENGIRNLDNGYARNGQSLRAFPAENSFKIKLPLIMPSFTAAAVNALGFAWKSGVAAEVICRPVNSIGRLLQDAKLYLETPRVFALTAVVAALSLLIELIIKRLARRYLNDKNT